MAKAPPKSVGGLIGLPVIGATPGIHLSVPGLLLWGHLPVIIERRIKRNQARFPLPGTKEAWFMHFLPTDYGNAVTCTSTLNTLRGKEGNKLLVVDNRFLQIR